jgi:hypothetical protein
MAAAGWSDAGRADLFSALIQIKAFDPDALNEKNTLENPCKKA